MLISRLLASCLHKTCIYAGTFYVCKGLLCQPVHVFQFANGSKYGGSPKTTSMSLHAAVGFPVSTQKLDKVNKLCEMIRNLCNFGFCKTTVTALFSLPCVIMSTTLYVVLSVCMYSGLFMESEVT